YHLWFKNGKDAPLYIENFEIVNDATYIYDFSLPVSGGGTSTGGGSSSGGSVSAFPQDAQFVSQSVPSQMVAGQSYNVSVTMKNRGTTAWKYTAPPDGYFLGAVGDKTTWVPSARVALNVGESVPPGASKVFNFKVTAPKTPGAYLFQWRMLEEFVK